MVPVCLGRRNGLTYHTFGKRCSFKGGQTQVTNLYRAGGSSDEDVVTLEVSVDDGGCPCMQEQQPLQDLPAPASQNLGLHHLEALQVPGGGAESSSSSPAEALSKALPSKVQSVTKLSHMSFAAVWDRQ